MPLLLVSFLNLFLTWFLKHQLGSQRTSLKSNSALAMSGIEVKVFSTKRHAILSLFSALAPSSTATPPPRERPKTTSRPGLISLLELR